MIVADETLYVYLIIFAGSAFAAAVLGITSLTYLVATLRVLALYLFALAALVFALGVPHAFLQQLYSPVSFDRFLFLWLLAVVSLMAKRHVGFCLRKIKEVRAGRATTLPPL